jgi:beta-xylosidase
MNGGENKMSKKVKVSQYVLEVILRRSVEKSKVNITPAALRRILLSGGKVMLITGAVVSRSNESYYLNSAKGGI